MLHIDWMDPEMAMRFASIKNKKANLKKEHKELMLTPLKDPERVTYINKRISELEKEEKAILGKNPISPKNILSNKEGKEDL